LGLLLNPADLPSRVIRGGQEHELFHDEASDRYFKVTRNGVFGLSPGIELALVSSSQDARRFHLWEASPLEYLERVDLQNQLVPGLNRLEGVIVQANGEMAIVTSQPRFDIVAVGVAEIDAWFAAQGFAKIAEARLLPGGGQPRRLRRARQEPDPRRRAAGALRRYPLPPRRRFPRLHRGNPHHPAHSMSFPRAREACPAHGPAKPAKLGDNGRNPRLQKATAWLAERE
jgi:hypothetical protein